MEPTPPKSRKPRYQRPFYEAGKKTSAEIIAEAKSSMKALDTSRPFTPAESKRSLFGSTSSRPSEGRPPSVFSLGPHSFNEPGSRPPTGKLTPLDRIYDTLDINSTLPPRSPQRPSYSQRLSLEKLPNNMNKMHIDNKVSDTADLNGPRHLPSPPKSTKDPIRSRSNKRGSFSKPKSSENEPVGSVRRVHSGPKERSNVNQNQNSLNMKKSQSMGNLKENNTNVVEEDMNDDMTNSSPNSRPRSDTTSETDGDAQVIYFKSNVKPLLDQMELNFLHKDFDALGINFDVLWKTLEHVQLLGRGTDSGTARRRNIVLRTIFQFVDADNPTVQLKLCKLALAMKVNGDSLSSICKLIFKISKDPEHDELFKAEGLIDILMTLEFGSPMEGIIYCAGAMKFLSGSSLLRTELIESGSLECLSEVLEKAYAIVTATLRNLADLSNVRDLFIKNDIIQNILKLLEFLWQDADYALNVSRILSKLTLYGDCCILVSQAIPNFGLLLKILDHHKKKIDIVVRVLFILGNVAAKVDGARYQLYFESNALDCLLETVDGYLLLSFEKKNHVKQNGETKMRGEIEEVLVKAIRVIANMSIHNEVGTAIVRHDRCLETLIRILEKKRHKESEELLINTAATLNNLSYYSSEESGLMERDTEITEALIRLLFMDNMDCIIEATRVFGNFTRSKKIRQIMLDHKVVQVLITLLDSSDREVVFSACGVLINLMVDGAARLILKNEGGVRKLIEALKDFGQTDWQLSSMICQTLWNYSERITSANSCFGESETEDLIEVLQEYLDTETALDYSSHTNIDSDTKELMKQIWTEQFQPVGVRLLTRIEEHHTILEPLVEEPD